MQLDFDFNAIFKSIIGINGGIFRKCLERELYLFIGSLRSGWMGRLENPSWNQAQTKEAIRGSYDYSYAGIKV